MSGENKNKEEINGEFKDDSSSLMEGTSNKNIVEPEQPVNVKPLNDLNENMEVHHHAHTHGKKKLEKLFLGILNVIPGRVLRIFGRVPTRACNRAPAGACVYAKFYQGFAKGYC